MNASSVPSPLHGRLRQAYVALLAICVPHESSVNYLSAVGFVDCVDIGERCARDGMERWEPHVPQ